MKDELKLAQEAAASGSKTKDGPIQRPLEKIGNLQVAMGLANDHQTFVQLRVCFFFFFILALIKCLTD